MSKYRVFFEYVTPFGASAVLFPGGHYKPPIEPIPEDWWHPTSRETEDESSAREQVERLLEWERTGEQPVRRARLEITGAPAPCLSCASLRAKLADAEAKISTLTRDLETGFMAGAYARLKNLQTAEADLARLRAYVEKRGHAEECHVPRETEAGTHYCIKPCPGCSCGYAEALGEGMGQKQNESDEAAWARLHPNERRPW